jgi:hypothetical protein
MNRQVRDAILAMVFFLYVIYKQFISQFVININGNLFGFCKPRDAGQHYWMKVLRCGRRCGNGCGCFKCGYCGCSNAQCGCSGVKSF